MGREFKCLQAICFLLSFSCPLSSKTYFSNNILFSFYRPAQETNWERTPQPFQFQYNIPGVGLVDPYGSLPTWDVLWFYDLHSWSVLVDPLLSFHSARVPHSSSGSEFPRGSVFGGAGQTPSQQLGSEVCGCDDHGTAVRTGRTDSHPSSATSSLSFFLTISVNFPATLLLACCFPTSSAGQPHPGPTPSSLKTRSPPTISRAGNGIPRTPKGFPPFHLSSWLQPGTQAQSLGLVCS